MRRPTHRGKRPQHASFVMVGLSLDGKSPPLVDFQLTEREYSTIGFVTVHWAYLEYALLDRTLNLARKARLKPPAEALSSRFKDRVDALKKIGERALKRNPELEKLRDLLKRVEGAYSQGLKLTHGHLTYNAQKPDLLWATLFLKPGAVGIAQHKKACRLCPDGGGAVVRAHVPRRREAVCRRAREIGELREQALPHGGDG